MPAKKSARRKAAKKSARKAIKSGAQRTKKVPRKAAKKTVRRRGAKKVGASRRFMQALGPSPALAAVVGGQPMPRTEVTRKLWAYIKKNNLQDSEDRHLIYADDKLRIIFGGRARVSIFELPKLVARHLSPTSGATSLTAPEDLSGFSGTNQPAAELAGSIEGASAVSVASALGRSKPHYAIKASSETIRKDTGLTKAQRESVRTAIAKLASEGRIRKHY